MKYFFNFTKIIFLTILFVSCQKNSGDGDKNLENRDLKSISLKFSEENSIVLASQFVSANFDISCANVYPGNVPWIAKSVTITLTNPTIAVVNKANCTLKLNNYIDQNGVYIPLNNFLILEIDANGNTNTIPYPVSYVSLNSSNSKKYFAGISSSYNITLNFSTDPNKAQDIIVDKKSLKSTTFTFKEAEVPLISNMQLTEILDANGVKVSYTLTGNVSNFDSCKVFESNAVNILPTSWEEVNNLFSIPIDSNNGVYSCVDLVNNPQDNWNAFSGKNTFIVWSKKTGNINGYAVYKVFLNCLE